MATRKNQISKPNPEAVRRLGYTQINYKREFIPPHSLRAVIPTLAPDSFDNTGEKILPWKLPFLFFACGLDTELENRRPKGEESLMVAAVYIELEIDPSFYDPTKPKFPLIVDSKYLFTKRTSRAAMGYLSHPSLATPYARLELFDVRVHPRTKQALPFPDWWKTRFEIPSEGQRKEHIVPSRRTTADVYVTEHKVAYSDTDYNGHANNTYYIRIAYDSFAENLFLGKLPKEAETYFENGLRKLKVTFQKECLMGDILNVESWVDERSRDTYYFCIKKNGELCVRLTLVFHRMSARSLASSL